MGDETTNDRFSPRAIIFDFDGTLILSNEIKRDCYLSVARNWPNGEAIATELLDGPAVGDRYAFFKLFSQRVSFMYIDKSLPISEVELVEDYSRRVEEALLVCPERPGAMSLIRNLHSKGIVLYLNSGTPLVWLRRIIEGRRIANQFSGVFGGPISKIDNLKRILQEQNLNTKDILIIGDGLDDEHYAFSSGCKFLPISGGPLSDRSNAISDYFNFHAQLDSIL